MSTTTPINSAAKKLRQIYSISQKSKVAQCARYHGGRNAARKLGVYHKNVQRWLKDEMETVKHPHRVKRFFKKGQGRKLSYPTTIDQEISKWILEKRDYCNAPISKQVIRLKAISLIKPFNPLFKVSDGWLKSFFRRHNWTLRRQTSLAQMLPVDQEEKIARFRQDVYNVRCNGDFPYDLIANMDETPIFFDMVPWCLRVSSIK